MVFAADSEPTERSLHTAGLEGGINSAVLRSVVDAAPDGFLLCDEQGSIVWVNERCEQLFGAPRSTLIGTGVETLTPRSATNHHELRARYVSAPSLRPMGEGRRLTARRVDGTEFPVEIGLSPITLDGRVFVVASVRDVRERLAVEDAAAEARRRLAKEAAQIIDFVGVTWWRIDADRRIASLGGPDGGRCGRLHPRVGEAIEPALQEHRALRLAIESAFAFVHHESTMTIDGRIHRVRVTPAETPAAGRSEPEEVVVLFLDVTEATHVRELAALADDRERIARDLHDTVVQQLFAAGLTIQGTRTRLDDAVIAARLDGVVDQIDGAIHQLRTSIFAANRRARTPNSLRSTLLAVAAESVRILPSPPIVDIDDRIDETPWAEVAVDLEAALRECLANVARHSSASSVTVTVRCEANEVELTVDDDGVGPGENLHTAGNGLRNLRERAALHHGEFDLIRRQPSGTRARFTALARER